VILKTSAGREIRLCCITQPDPVQRALLDRMGLAPVRQLKVFSFFFKKIWLIRIDQKRFGEHYLLKRFVV
jgi:hypothetical protein